MGRPKATISDLLTEKPVSGQAYIVKDLRQENAYIRVRTPAHRDLKGHPELAPLMRFSGPDQFFRAQLFRTETFLKFPCGKSVERLVDPPSCPGEKSMRQQRRGRRPAERIPR